MNSMRNIRIEKVTLNIGCGRDQSRIDKGLTLLQHLSGKKPVKTYTSKRIQEWGLRPGLPIGCKVTLRKDDAQSMVKRALDAKEKKLEDSQFDENGNISFGILEYIDIPEAVYDPNIGILGLQVCVTLERPGSRVKKRKLQKRKLPEHQRVSREEAIDFMKQNYGIRVGDEE